MKLTLDDLVELLKGKRYSHYVAARCPFPEHEDSHPSLLAFDDGFFRCQGCGQHGTHYELVQQVERGGARSILPDDGEPPPTLPTGLEELRDLAEKAHWELMRNPSCGLYYKERGITPDVVEMARLGYYMGWCTIPIYGWNRKFAGLFLRYAGEARGRSRFHQPDGQKGMLYYPDPSRIVDTRHVFIVFGMFDALALAVVGQPVFTPTSGKDSFRVEWLEPLPRYVTITIIPDDGEFATGMKLAEQIGVRAKVAKIDWPEGCKDPADVLRENGRAVFAKWIRRMMEE